MADDLDRLFVALVVDVLAVGLAPGQAIRPLEHLRVAVVRGPALQRPVTADELDLVVRHVDALRADRLREVGAKHEHVATSEELLRTGHVNDGAGVDGGRGSKRDTSRDVRLDETGDDVDGGPLRAEDEVDAGGAGQLRHAGDLLLHLDRRLEHEVGELVDDEDDVRDAVGAGVLLVVLADVPRARPGEKTVAAVHLPDHPEQGVQDLVRVGHDRGDEVRDVAERGEVDPLEVPDEEADVVRRRVEQQAAEDRADVHALAGAGLTRDEQVRHRAQVEHDRGARDVASERDGEL